MALGRGGAFGAVGWCPHEAPPSRRLPRATPLGETGADAGDGVLLDPLVHGRREGMTVDVDVRSSGFRLKHRWQWRGVRLPMWCVGEALSKLEAHESFHGVAIIIRRAA
jgi:hypothetical protein